MCRASLFACLAFFLAGCQFCDRRIIENPEAGAVIRVINGDRYYFDLEENQTTGYSWYASCDDADVEVTMDHESAEPTEDGETLCGAPGKVAVRLRVRRGFDGPATIRFFYKRPWEETPIKSFNIVFYRRTGDAAFWKK